MRYTLPASRSELAICARGVGRAGGAMVTARRRMPDPARDEDALVTMAASASGAAPRPASPEGSANPTFGVEYWGLGLAAIVPALLTALALLACAGVLPLIPRLPVGLTLGGLLVLFALGALGAHVLDYPAWSQPGVVLVPILALFLPAAILRGQVLTQINGDTDLVVLAPLVISWLLMVAATIVCVGVAITIGRHAPSFAGLTLLPLPLIQAWLLILAPPFREPAVIAALGSALVLTALGTFVAWVVPLKQRPHVPLVAIAAQFGIFWLQRFGWPTFNGVVRPIVALDIAFYVAVLLLIATAPPLATWMRRAAWPVLHDHLG